jgi:hypothetical protein
MHGRFSVARICELLTQGDDERVVRELVRQVRQSARADFLVGAFTSSPAAWRCGLVRSNRTAMIAANPLREGQRGAVEEPRRANRYEGEL